MPRLVCISDTHSMHRKIKDVPDGDVLIHAGDWSGRGTLAELVDFNTWLGALPHKHKLVTAGNHDAIAKDHGYAQAILTNATLLIDQGATIDGVSFYMSPWTPRFGNWDFMAERGHPMRAKWNKIPDQVDVLVTHGPPFYVLDLCPNGRVGCKDLLTRVFEVKPKVHVFGHIHESHGEERGMFTRFVNASICDGSYNPINLPTVIDL